MFKSVSILFRHSSVCACRAVRLGNDTHQGHTAVHPNASTFSQVMYAPFGSVTCSSLSRQLLLVIFDDHHEFEFVTVHLEIVLVLAPRPSFSLQLPPDPRREPHVASVSHNAFPGCCPDAQVDSVLPTCMRVFRVDILPVSSSTTLPPRTPSIVNKNPACPAIHGHTKCKASNFTLHVSSSELLSVLTMPCSD